MVVLVATLQPIVIGLIAIVGIGRSFNGSFFFKKTNGIRSKLPVTRLYECSTYSRLSQVVIFEISYFSIALSHIIYDVDFIFFLSEVTVLGDYSMLDVFALTYLLVLFFLGLWFDDTLSGFSMKF